MSGSGICRIVCLLTVLVCGIESALGEQEWATGWWRGDQAEDSRWNNPDNWWMSAGTIPPGPNDTVDINRGSGIQPIIDDDNVGDNIAVCRNLWVPDWQDYDSTPCTLIVTGGILQIGKDFTLGRLNTGGTYPWVDTGILEMSGGIVTIGAKLSVGGRGNDWGANVGGEGTINMTGGSITCDTLYIPEGYTPGTGVVNLDGGTIQAQNFIMNPNEEPNGLMYITDGMLILDGNQVDLVDSYVDSNWLLPGNPNYSIISEYIQSSDLTNVFALDIWRASNPNPEDGTVKVPYNVILSWNAGTTASDTNGHDVYLGTDRASVENATVETPLGVYMGRQTPTTFDTAPLPLEKGVPYYWRIDEVNELTEPDTILKGYVWTFTLDDGKAYNPSPADNSTEVPIDTILAWSPGSFSDGTHQVYLGTSYQDINSATSGYVTRSEPNYSPDTLLTMEQTYYWRVDAVNGVDKSKGHIWSFTTAGDYLIDDFEDYGINNQIYQTWVSSDTVQVEEETVYQGNQAMRFRYYSAPAGANRTFDTNQNWIEMGVKALRLCFYGESYNTGGPISVSLEDADGDTTTVNYPDSNDISASEWIEWNISTQDFAVGNMDLNKVKKIRISVGGSGSGDIYVDHIQGFVSRCLPGYGPDVDFTGDSFVNEEDLDSMCDSWLLSGYDVSASASIPQPKVWYDFNETSWTDTTAYDKSGNGYDATYEQDPCDPGVYRTRWNESGKIGGCLEFVGNFAMSVPSGAFDTDMNDLTIAFWIKGLTIQAGTWPTMFHGSNSPDVDYLMLAQWNPEGDLIYGMGNSWMTWSNATAEDYYDDWNHYTFVKKASTGEMTIYLNGIPVAKTNDATDTLSSLSAFYIGSVTLQYEESYIEALMDDFRIYDTALTNEQVLKLLGLSSVHVPLVPLLSASDPYADDRIDLRDFAKVAEYWLKTPLWP